MRVLHRDLRTELNVRSNRVAELFTLGEVRRVHRFHVELDEPLSLLFRNPKVPMNLDEVCEAEFSGKAVGTSEGLSGEGSEMIDVFGLTRTEERLE